MRLRLVACAPFALAAALAACSTSKPPAIAPAPTSDGKWLVLERYACLGACPAYVLTVGADGRVEFVGKNAYADGRHEKRLDPSSMRALRAALDGARLSRFARRYDRIASSDLAGADLAVQVGAGWKEVEFHLGDPATPPDLVALAARVDAIVGTAPWIDLDRGVSLKPKIYFDDHDARLRPTSASIVASMAETLKAHVKIEVRVVGHVAVDEPEWLARVRAFEVRAALIAAGVDASRLTIGSSPIGVVATPDEDDPLAKQRCVELERIDGK